MYGIATCASNGKAAREKSMIDHHLLWTIEHFTIQVMTGCQIHCWKVPLHSHNLRMEPFLPIHPSNVHPLLSQNLYSLHPSLEKTPHKEYMDFSFEQYSVSVTQKAYCSHLYTLVNSIPNFVFPEKSHCSLPTRPKLGSCEFDGFVVRFRVVHFQEITDWRDICCHWTWNRGKS
jgi:hypothetical protein